VRIPTSLYGFYRDVQAAAGKAVTRLKRGATLPEAFLADDFSHTASSPGLIALHGPSPLLGGQQHFHCYLPLLVVMKAIDSGRLDRSVEPRVFRDALECDWGLLAVLSPTNLMSVFREDRHWPFVRKLLPRWEELRAEGLRYSVGSASGDDLWAHNSNLKYVLARLGVPDVILNSPLPPHGLPRLVHSIDSSGSPRHSPS